MAGTLKTARKAMDALLVRDCPKIAFETAQEWRELADQIVPQIGNARFASNALRFSATIGTPSKSDYAKTIASALKARQAAIDAGQPWAAPLEILPEPQITTEPNVAIAKLFYPVGHAVEVHEGLGGTTGARPFMAQTKPGQNFKARHDVLAREMEKISV